MVDQFIIGRRYSSAAQRKSHLPPDFKWITIMVCSPRVYGSCLDSPCLVCTPAHSTTSSKIYFGKLLSTIFVTGIALFVSCRKGLLSKSLSCQILCFSTKSKDSMPFSRRRLVRYMSPLGSLTVHPVLRHIVVLTVELQAQRPLNLCGRTELPVSLYSLYIFTLLKFPGGLHSKYYCKGLFSGSHTLF